MRFIDLKSNPFQDHPCASLRKEMAEEFRKDGVLSADGFSTFIRVSPLCRSLPGQLQSEELFMLGSVSVFGLCSPIAKVCETSRPVCEPQAKNSTTWAFA